MNKYNQFWITTNLFLNGSLENILRISIMTQSYQKKKNHMKTKHKKMKMKMNNNKSESKNKKIISLISKP